LRGFAGADAEDFLRAEVEEDFVATSMLLMRFK
jgi:hypothetical protein